jgi:ABC-2 type transport system permease protein
MHKIGLVIKREYLTRVRKRSFILVTILVPLLLIGLMAGMVAIAVSSGSTKHIAVLDESQRFEGKLQSGKSAIYEFSKDDIQSLKDNEEYDAVLHIPPFEESVKNRFSLYSKESIGLDAQNDLEQQLNNILINDRMNASGISVQTLDSLRAHNIAIVNIDKEGKNKSTELAYGIGYVSGFLLYMFMLLYGMSVMRSVMEEKTNRIAEIIVSSVKPYQLMMGKIIGVALVGLTQFLIWVALISILSIVGSALVGASLGASDIMNQAAAAQQQVPTTMDSQGLEEIMAMLSGNANWLAIFLWFLVYFLGGYFIYAALFAAVGSLVNEDPNDAQQLTLPVTMPIIFAFVAMSITLRDPNGGMAVFCSIFPLTSPVVMMARIPFGVPTWQLAASVICLILGFMGTTWIAAKIYRTGILLYGKKVTLKEVGKWLVRK